MTFGLKVAGWLDATIRHIERLRAMRPRVLAVQLGGAVGTLSALGDKGLEVIALLAADLRLTAPNLPWHANRDRLAEVATTLGLIVGTLGKMARDISLMAQTEVGELAEPHEPGRGRSTALPQKQNPVSCAAVLGAAHRVPALVSIMLAGMVQEHERGLGGWQAEWETLPEICTLAAGALAHSCHLAQGLVVSAGQMAANLDFTKGLVQAQAVAVVLGRQIGRPRAHELLERACQLAIQQDRHLRDVLADDPDVKTHLSAGELQNLFNIRHDIQCAGLLVDQVLAAAERVIKRRPDK